MILWNINNIKKLLLILLLFFPVHGAWAKEDLKSYYQKGKSFVYSKFLQEEILDMFGVRMGQKCNSKNFKIIDRKALKDAPKGVREEFSSNIGLFFLDISRNYMIKAPKKNENFNKYFILCSVKTNRVFGVSAGQAYKKEQSSYICQSKTFAIYDILKTKYNLPKAFIIEDQHISGVHIFKITNNKLAESLDINNINLKDDAVMIGCSNNSLHMTFISGFRFQQNIKQLTINN